MKRYTMLLAAIGCLWIASCNKNKDSISTEQLNVKGVNGAWRDGEDDDILIIIKTKGSAYQPLQGTSVSLYDGVHTFPGTTNASGECTLHLDHLGEWFYHAAHQGYEPIDDTIELDALINYRTDTMQEL